MSEPITDVDLRAMEICAEGNASQPKSWNTSCDDVLHLIATLRDERAKAEELRAALHKIAHSGHGYTVFELQKIAQRASGTAREAPSIEAQPAPHPSPDIEELRAALEQLHFSGALLIAQDGFNAWKAKPHNAKWFKRIDGTPIPNDLLVNIAEAIAAFARAALGEKP